MSFRLFPVLALLVASSGGCMLLPDVVHQPQYHNPFPQLHRVAVLPFFNLSDEPTVDQDRFAAAYFDALQQIPGFEVVAVGTTKKAMLQLDVNPGDVHDLRRLARALNVDVIVVGAVTDYSPYYPPRLGLAVNWYSANPCFHPIPAGYGLPWGTAEEEYIPDDLVREAEFELARAQLATQTPRRVAENAEEEAAEEKPAGAADPPPESIAAGGVDPVNPLRPCCPTPTDATNAIDTIPPDSPELPDRWPDPRGFVPPPPAAERPSCDPYDGPIIRQVRNYNGHDADLTAALANYHYFRDDGRSGAWQAYLQRSEDFIRFCCHLHITEMLAARGGADQTRVVLRWPIGRYER